MQALTIQDILPIAEFTAQRRQIQGKLKQVRAPRRVALGPNFMFFFENRATLQWQIQEMCRVETITDDVGVQHELDTYNALLPTADSLSATLLLAWDEVEVRDAALRDLVDLPGKLALTFDGLPDAPAVFDEMQFNTERLSSVQFLRFPLSDAQRDALARLDTEVAIAVSHPAATFRAVLSGATRGALLDDLRAS